MNDIDALTESLQNMKMNEPTPKKRIIKKKKEQVLDPVSEVKQDQDQVLETVSEVKQDQESISETKEKQETEIKEEKPKKKRVIKDKDSKDSKDSKDASTKKKKAPKEEEEKPNKKQAIEETIQHKVIWHSYTPDFQKILQSFFIKDSRYVGLQTVNDSAEPIFFVVCCNKWINNELPVMFVESISYIDEFNDEHFKPNWEKPTEAGMLTVEAMYNCIPFDPARDYTRA